MTVKDGIKIGFGIVIAFAIVGFVLGAIAGVFSWSTSGRATPQRASVSAESEASKLAYAAYAKREEEERQAKADEWQRACVPYADCLRGHVEDSRACKKAEAAFEYFCSSTLRDADACGQKIAAMKNAPAQADCGTALRPRP